MPLLFRWVFIVRVREKLLKISVNVSVMLNTDTVQTLIDNGVLTDVEVLPSEYVLQIPQNIQIPDGKNETTFDVSVALDFLRKDVHKSMLWVL